MISFAISFAISFTFTLAFPFSIAINGPVATPGATFPTPLIKVVPEDGIVAPINVPLWRMATHAVARGRHLSIIRAEGGMVRSHQEGK